MQCLCRQLLQLPDVYLLRGLDDLQRRRILFHDGHLHLQCGLRREQLPVLQCDDLRWPGHGAGERKLCVQRGVCGRELPVFKRHNLQRKRYGPSERIVCLQPGVLGRELQRVRRQLLRLPHLQLLPGQHDVRR